MILRFLRNLLGLNARVQNHEILPTYVPIYVATATGKATALAEFLVEKGRPLNIQFDIIQLQNFRPYDFLTSRLVIFFLSTGGNGDPPLNAGKFVEWLDGSDIVLDHMTYAIFGCGNSLFANYNSFAKNIDRSMRSLYAVPLIPLALGDASQNMFTTYQTWSDSVVARLPDQIVANANSQKMKNGGGTPSSPSSGTSYTQALAEPVSIASVSFDGLGLDESWNPRKMASGGRSFRATSSFEASRTSSSSSSEASSSERLNSRTTSKSANSTKRLQMACAGHYMTIRLNIEGATCAGVYPTGSNAELWIPNPKTTVAYIAERFDFQLDEILTFPATNRFSPYPASCTRERFLTYFVNLHSVSKEIQEKLAGFTPEVPAFFNLLEARGEVLHHYSFVEFLEACPSLSLTWDEFRERVPVLRPRSFTIGSSAMTSATQITLLVNPRTEFSTSMTAQTCPVFRNDRGEMIREWRGYATNYFIQCFEHQHEHARASLPRDVFPVLIKTSRSFLAQVPLDAPLICIAKADGITAMKGILEERLWAKEQEQVPNVGTCELYYECDKKRNFVFRDEFERLKKENIVNVLCCFSEEEKDDSLNGNKVTDLLRAKIKDIWHKIEHENAHVLLCGYCDFGESVHRILYDNPSLYHKYFSTRVHGEYTN